MRHNGMSKFAACKFLDKNFFFKRVAYEGVVRQSPTSCQEPLQSCTVSLLPQRLSWNQALESNFEADQASRKMKECRQKEPQPPSPKDMIGSLFDNKGVLFLSSEAAIDEQCSYEEFHSSKKRKPHKAFSLIPITSN